MEKYTIVTLLPLNGVYHMNHKISQDDVEMANNYKAIIEASRTDNRIQPGDILELYTRYGDYRRNAHFEKWDRDKGYWAVCEHPSTPFIWLNITGDNIQCSTSGGPWTSVPGGLRLMGKRKKLFKDWGHCGSCANGSVAFEAEVNVWEYRQPDPLFGEYSTKDYDKHYISHCVDERGNPKSGSRYRYVGDSTNFETSEEYSIWLKTFCGVEFEGHWPNQTVVFCYKRVEKLLSKAEYNDLDLPVDTRVCNGVIEVKVFYDDVLRTVTEYRCTNDGSELARRGVKAYLLARQAV